MLAGSGSTLDLTALENQRRQLVVVVHGHESHAGRIDPQLAQQVLKEFARIALRLEQVGCTRRVAKSLEHLILEASYWPCPVLRSAPEIFGPLKSPP